MLLVDTSVWIAHLRYGDVGLIPILEKGYVACHPFVIGELACGNLKNRSETLSLLRKLPMAVLAEHNEVMELIDSRSLMGKGPGYIDVHLLASAMLTRISFWTLDRKLAETAAKLNLL